MSHRQPFPPLSDHTATCPECTACVPLIDGRWLAAHRTGSAEHPYPHAVRERCPGSLLVIQPPAPTR
jgi:hypothetical protein